MSSHDRSVDEVFDIKQLKDTLKADYREMADYILVMAKASNSEQFSKALSALNVVRKYYADLLAKRRPPKKGQQQEHIPEIK